ncbi:MAG: response regulator [Planctomycetes bacterium]|nr:response regulator [Planctomycetota bacterium]
MAADELRILFVEDSAQDTELEVRVLEKGGLAFRSMRVETREALARALGEFKPTVVISDYTLPRLDGLSALKLVREASVEVPFIFVSGTIGEDRAVASLKQGATDYIIKGRLGGLPHAVERALLEAKERSERQKLEAELRESQKMEAIGRLAGGVAHDFNNLLMVMTGYTQLVRSRLAPQDPSQADLGEVERAGERAVSLVRQLLAYSRKQVLQPRLLDLNAVVLETVSMLRPILGAGIELEGRLNLKFGRVMLDRGQIERVILNLALNSRDAMPEGGRLTIETADAGTAGPPPDAAPGPHVLLTVSDTGRGMTDQVRSHLFEPFFTTKEPGQGTGLGLSTVYGIIRQSGGSIRVDSGPGKGTTLRIFLPRANPRAELPGPAAPAPRGSETILVVENREEARNLIRSILAGQGYTVLEAPGGHGALSLVERSGTVIHLLLTSLVLPEMSGQELAATLRVGRPELKVLYMSGYSEEGESPSLPKPFTSPDRFVERVRAMLDGS